MNKKELKEWLLTQFQSHNGLILIRKKLKTTNKTRTFQSHNGLILIISTCILKTSKKLFQSHNGLILI